MNWCASVPSPSCLNMGFIPALTNSAVSKLCQDSIYVSALGIALSEKQILQVVETSETEVEGWQLWNG
jgi:hypothetical protein